MRGVHGDSPKLRRGYYAWSSQKEGPARSGSIVRGTLHQITQTGGHRKELNA